MDVAYVRRVLNRHDILNAVRSLPPELASQYAFEQIHVRNNLIESLLEFIEGMDAEAYQRSLSILSVMFDADANPN